MPGARHGSKRVTEIWPIRRNYSGERRAITAAVAARENTANAVSQMVLLFARMLLALNGCDIIYAGVTDRLAGSLHPAGHT